MLNSDSIILKTDGYKPTQFRQYPKNTTEIYSYFESRGGKFAEVVPFGFQYIVKKHFLDTASEGMVYEARDFFADYYGDKNIFNFDGWMHIAKAPSKTDPFAHNGRLPIELRALPEGLVVPTGTVLMTLRNTCEQCYWLTNYLETLAVQAWYPTTVATLSHEFKKLLQRFLDQTSDNTNVDFMLNDFGYRGATSNESAGIAGAAHLLSFKGSDTIKGITTLMDYYGAKKPMGFSIPASEHSTITSWGREHEGDACENMLDAYPNSPLVACVSDSYDIYACCEHIWGERLRDKIKARKGFLVVRPDSGHPPTVVLKCLEIIGEKFGTTANSKGYKVLNNVRIIQGDGVDLNMATDVMIAIIAKGWAAENVCFGCGGGLHQNVNRDTLKMAFKCSSITADGVTRDVFKAPATDSGKNSKRGKFSVIYGSEGGFRNVPQFEHDPLDQDLLQPVLVNSMLRREHTYDDIAARLADWPYTQ